MKKESGNSKGFTIVELLMVVTILAILVSIITMGVNGMFRSARQKRASAMKLVLKSGLEAYYAQRGEWPSGIAGHVEDDEDSVELSDGEADNALGEVVSESVKAGSGVSIDPTGLYVAEKGKNSCYDNHHNRKVGYKFCGNLGCVRGREFAEAVRKGDRHLSPKQMAFGYAGPNNGYFCRYRIIFHPKTDTVEVRMQQANEDNWKDD